MFIKQLLVIGTDQTITTKRGYDFSGEFDMDCLAGTLNFKLPLIDSYNEQYFENDDLLYLKTLPRYTSIKLYYQKFEIDPGEVTTDDLVLIFTGYLDKLLPTRNKSEYSLTIDAIGTLGLTGEFSLFANVEIVDGGNYLSTLFTKSGFSNIVPVSSITNYLSDNSRDLLVKWSKSTNLKEVLETARDKYGIKTHQKGDGSVMVFDAFSLFDNNFTEWELRLGETAFDVQYADATERVDMVIVYGAFGSKGIAADPTSLGNKQINFSNIQDENMYRKEEHYRYDITDPLQLESIARNILFDKIRNNIIMVKTLFEPEYSVLQYVKVYDGEFYDGDRFVVKKINFRIMKTDVSCDLTCFKSPLGLAPENLVTDTEGFTDLRTLEIYKDVSDDGGWNEW